MLDFIRLNAFAAVTEGGLGSNAANAASWFASCKVKSCFRF